MNSEVFDQSHTKTRQGTVHTPPHQTGDKAIVLGAREGNIGGAIAEQLCEAGWIATEDDCSQNYADGVRGELSPHYGYGPPAAHNLKHYDACVITLGVTHMEPFSKVSGSDLRKVLYGSLELPLECARRYVQARQHEFGFDRVPWKIEDVEPIGSIIFVGSYAYDHPFTHCTSYCAAKAGLDMAVKSLAWELMPEGFDVHIIHPHHVDGTPMTEVVLKGMQDGVHHMTVEEAKAYQHKDLRMPHLLTPEEIAEMVLWLLTAPVARWFSGQGLHMYGGVR